MPVRLQFGLPKLLGLVTILCFGFAYPRFTIGAIALLSGVLIALCVFALLVYYPIMWLAEFGGRREEPHSNGIPE